MSVARRQLIRGFGLAGAGAWAGQARIAVAQPAGGSAVPAAPTTGPLAEPAGRVILAITGKIAITNDGDAAKFDRPMLEALGMASFTTVTPWYDGAVTFEGVPMTRLLQRVGAQGETVQAVALNDYSTEIPVADFARWGVMLALKRDGNYLTIRDKGPLFIVYPYDTNAELRSPRYYGRSAWQVARLVVR
ncbi:molybdopterin-dependent oxidoreductase [Paeniroseomonas aquatica]|uniref:Molybdopterin-dependent oxidoreductase n=2 Tax=Paeniroseomonas aquatica TaxID=373043 RepID=A0ABT8AF02_9PROT|nr:molybdopterin-dependent oxidoreductase [Paeniroseomonas aquatica]MDN3568190.1 molybdopterin-dependent oxidoreductase [Paeniroseomonas aquatica]